MNHTLLAIAALSLGCAAASAAAGPPPGGGRYAGPPRAYPGVGYRPFYPGYRPLYPGWRGGYWGPGVGVYLGGPGYWGAWPYGYGWGAAYSLPYAVAPLVVNAAPAPQVLVQPSQLIAQQPQASEPPATSYWYYCTQPAGYFPYVQDCSQAWMKVVPQVPGSTTTPPRLAP
jgi:hypothetical protein